MATSVCSRLLRPSLQIRVHHPFTAPHSDDRDHGIVTAIDYSIWGHLKFAKPRGIELRDDPAAIREHCELTDALQDCRNKSPADLGRLLLPYARCLEKSCSAGQPSSR